ncbi:hypothetical protein AB0J38_25995 [Streptomyces sp. NPDC050095]|uniref:hypothetical protein n=1 Tax=unclassified Streptomyces TaxID=2593676 RepID=UPI003445027B
MIGRAIALGVICAPFLSALLLGLGRAGRTLYRRARRRHSCTRSTAWNPNNMQPAVNATDSESSAPNTHRATTHTSTPHTAEIANATADHRSHPIPTNYPPGTGT